MANQVITVIIHAPGNMSREEVELGIRVKKPMEVKRLATSRMGRPPVIDEITKTKAVALYDEGETQAEIADYLGVTQRTVSNLLRSDGQKRKRGKQ